MKGHFANVCCVRLHLMLSAKGLGMLVKSAHKNYNKAKEDRCLMRFLNFAKMKETWTWEICFPTVEKNHRSKQNSVDTSNQVLRLSEKNIKETRWQFSWKDPQFSWWEQAIVYPQIMCFPWLF